LIGQVFPGAFALNISQISIGVSSSILRVIFIEECTRLMRDSAEQQNYRDPQNFFYKVEILRGN
tara:strand:- start:15282 stop:15473 length:192 start_codon:yes stop_codon:yes gene_type:complete